MTLPISDRRARHLFTVLSAGLFILSLFLFSKAAYAETVAYDLWVGDTRITSDNKDKIPNLIGENAHASFDPEKNVLTFSGTVEGIRGNTALCKIYSELTSLTINGDASIHNDCIIKNSTSSLSSAILTHNGDLIVNGDLKLTGEKVEDNYYSIFCHTDDISNGRGRLTVNGMVQCDQAVATKGKLDINGKAVCKNNMIYSIGDLKIAKDALVEARCLYSTGDTNVSGKVHIVQNSYDSSTMDRNAMYSDNLTVEDPAELLIECIREGEAPGSNIPCGMLIGSDVVIEGGKVSVISKGNRFRGIFASKLTVNAGNLDISTDGNDSMGINVDEMRIGGGKVSLQSKGKRTISLMSVYSLTITDGALRVDSDYECIRALNDGLQMTGGVLRAKTTYENPALRAMIFGDFHISGVKIVIPQGGSFVKPSETANFGVICEQDGKTFAKEILLISESHVHKRPDQIPVIKEPTCEEQGQSGEIYCDLCGERMSNGESIPALGHDWGEWKILREATADQKGIRERICKRDPSHFEKEEFSASLEMTEKTILARKDEKDPEGSTFFLLQAKGVSKNAKTVKLSWKAVPGAATYVIYGNKCGKQNAYERIDSVTKTAFTAKKLKKGTYYKFLVVAADGNGNTLALSKTIHVATQGGKKGNHRKVTLKPKKLKLSVGKTRKLKAKLLAGKKKVGNHRKVAWESDDPAVAIVSGGKVKAVGKGKCTIYAYAQNGVCAKTVVTVGN